MKIAILITIIFYILSILMLTYHLKTKEKNHFLISVLFIIFGSFTFHASEGFDSEYILFFLAIVFSFIGDLFMAKKIKLVDSRIINGTIGFGVAHILYILAFYKLNSQSIDLWEYGIGIILLCLIYYFIIYSPELPKPLKISTFVYALLISLLFVVILDVTINSDNSFTSSLFALTGIFLFVISDSIIAYTEFKRKISHSSEIIALTYIISQIMLQSTIILIRGV